MAAVRSVLALLSALLISTSASPKPPPNASSESTLFPQSSENPSQRSQTTMKPAEATTYEDGMRFTGTGEEQERMKKHLVRMLNMVAHSNFCLNVAFRLDDPERRLEIRVAGFVDRCSIMEPFCSLLLKNNEVSMGCLSATEENMKNYQQSEKNGRVSTKYGNGVICLNALCQLTESVAIGVPEIWQTFRWRLLDWIRDEGTSRNQYNGQNSEGEDESTGLIVVIAALTFIPVFGISVMCIVNFHKKNAENRKKKEKKQKRQITPEEALILVDEKTESQAKMTQL